MYSKEYGVKLKYHEYKFCRVWRLRVKLIRFDDNIFLWMNSIPIRYYLIITLNGGVTIHAEFFNYNWKNSPS